MELTKLTSYLRRLSVALLLAGAASGCANRTESKAAAGPPGGSVTLWTDSTELFMEHPALIVSAMAKAQRTGKVFIDWSQNSDFKTTVAPYSLRAKNATPYVSLPVRWEELQATLDSGDKSGLYFEPEAAVSRLKSTGDLFAPVLSQKQKLRAEPKKRAPRGRAAKEA